MEEITLAREDFAQITSAAEFILAKLAHAQGRAESYAARRAEFKILQFPTIKKAPAGEEVTKDKGKNGEKAEFWKKHTKEISKMQKTIQMKIQKAIAANPRFHKGVYEKRAMINGILIYGCAPKLDECESRFLTDLTIKLAELQPSEDRQTKKPKSNTTFGEWSDIWFEQIFKPSVIPYTFEKELKQFRNHVLPFFGERKLRDISPLDCIRFFNQMKEKNIERTAESCYGKLNRIFNFAVESRLISKSPMANMKPIKHERENGTPLTKEEETMLLLAVRGKKYEPAIILALYTGLRPCEMETARIEGNFIVAQNRKQKNVKKIVYKKIPITPMLEPHRALIERTLPELTRKFSNFSYSQTFKNVLSNHRLYDLRDTFATRCQECGVIEQAVQCFMGHAPRTLLGKVYTKFSDEFLYSEGQKVKY